MNKGFMYALAASFLLPVGIITNKYLMDFVNPRMLAFVWFFSVFIGSSILILYREPKSYAWNIRKHWKDGFIVGGFNAVAVSFFFIALNILEPATMAFLVRFSTIFTIALGIVFLKEKVTYRDLIGVLLAVAGALVIHYGSVSITAIAIVTAMLAALGIALHQVAAKKFVKKVHPLHLVNIRVLFTSGFLLIVVLVTGSLQQPPINVFPILAVTAGILSVAGFVFFYKSLELIDVSKAAVVRTADPFVVILYSVILFSIFPSVQEIIGGLLIISGVFIVMVKQGKQTVPRTHSA